MQRSFCLNQQCMSWQQAPCEPSHTSLGRCEPCQTPAAWTLDTEPQTARQQKLMIRTMQRQTRQDTTIKSLETSQGKHASLTFSGLTVASWLLMAFCAGKNATKREHEHSAADRICRASHRICTGPRHSSGSFPREAPAGEDTAELDGGMDIFHLKMGVGSCRKGVSISPQQSIASTSPQLGMIICLFSRENCCPVSTLPCDRGGLATTCRPQWQMWGEELCPVSK